MAMIRYHTTIALLFYKTARWRAVAGSGNAEQRGRRVDKNVNLGVIKAERLTN